MSSKIEISFHLDDHEAIEEACNFLSSYLNANRVSAAKERLLPKRTGVLEEEPRAKADFIPATSEASIPEPPAPDAQETKLPAPRATVIPEPPVADRVPEPPAPESEVDSTGEVWDPDKHSEGKTKTNDGRWRKRRAPKEENQKTIPAPPSSTGLAPEELTYKVMMDKLKGAGLDLEGMNLLAQQIGKKGIALTIGDPDSMAAVLNLAGLE